eukprot:6191557-Pleurochrysis_carterae.AAC.2
MPARRQAAGARSSMYRRTNPERTLCTSREQYKRGGTYTGLAACSSRCEGVGDTKECGRMAQLERNRNMRTNYSPNQERARISAARTHASD